MQLTLNISFTPAPGPDETSIIGAPITFGEDKKRWQIKGLTSKMIDGDKKPENYDYFAFVGRKNGPDSECPVRIVRFRIDSLKEGTISESGKEIALCIDEGKKIRVWLPLSEPPSPIIEG